MALLESTPKITPSPTLSPPSLPLATSNFDAGIARLLKVSDLERGTYRNQFLCLRDVVSIVPPLAALRRKPVALGTQVALVVGLEGAPITTERDHRIKVQFPWQRGVAPMAGGAAETGSLADPEGNAPGDDTSGTWVRVSEALSGANWGSNFTPRIGVEVLVDFVEADMDRPVIVAQLYNGSDVPPFSAGVDSGVNHAVSSGTSGSLMIPKHNCACVWPAVPQPHN